MKEIYTNIDFPDAPGGNIYHWQEADISFDVPEEGYYVVAITASAANAQQNRSTDDDDLRVEIDEYAFGMHEAHQAKISWRGFGTAASWDGASLRGGIKTIYFFVGLTMGSHRMSFFADGKPKLHCIKIFQVEGKGGAVEDVIFSFNEKAAGISIDAKGIPWKAFIFTGDFNTTDLSVKLVDVEAICQSAQQKGGTDGDNIRVYVNGQIIQNSKAPTSDKYKNFFFTGDLSRGMLEVLPIDSKVLLWGERDMSIELWYDQTPLLNRVKVELTGIPQYNPQSAHKRWLGYVTEAKHWPLNLWDDFLRIRDINREANNAALQYSDEHGFTFTDDEGKIVRPWVDNEVDAFRHFAWNMLLTRKYDANIASIITTNHEVFWMDAEHKQEMSRADVLDMWNNLQGREYAVRYPDKEYAELFDLAKSEGNLILALEDVTQQHRKITEDIVRPFRP